MDRWLLDIRSVVLALLFIAFRKFTSQLPGALQRPADQVEVKQLQTRILIHASGPL